jgi:heme exporter protein C
MKGLLRPVEITLGRLTSRRGERWLGISALTGLAISVVLSLLVVPPDARQGNVQRLMYVHVPSAWLAYVAFTTVFVASILFLWTRRGHWDHVAAASAEIGVVFTVLTIVLGSLWGYPTWGTFWTWDPRLTTTAVMLLIYVAYLGVRRLPDAGPRRARWAAVLGIAGFVDIPIVHMSVVWWRSLHQQATVLQPGSPTIAPSMLFTLLFAVVAFTVVYGYLMAVRMRLGRLEDKVVGAAIVYPKESPSTELEADLRAAEATLRG